MTSTFPRRSRKAGICLALGAIGLSQGVPAAAPMAERLGALFAALAFIAVGCWYAFREGGLFARVCACAAASMLTVGFVIGLVKGASHRESAREVDSEMANLRGAARAAALDTTPGAKGPSQLENASQDSMRRMQASENEETAALGRAMEALSKLNEDTNAALVVAIDGVNEQRFLDVSDMLATGDFAWQRATLAKYQAAVKAAAEANVRFPDAARACLAKCGLRPVAGEGILRGIRNMVPLSARMFQAHDHAAQTYASIIDFLESHRAEIVELEDGGLEMPEEHAPTYEKLVVRRAEAEQLVETARQALLKAMAEG